MRTMKLMSARRVFVGAIAAFLLAAGAQSAVAADNQAAPKSESGFSIVVYETHAR